MNANKACGLLMLALLVIEAIPVFGQEMNPNDAIKVLSTTKPIAYSTYMMKVEDAKIRLAAIKLYEQQMAAISVLAKAKALGSAQFLIPYLDYPVPSLNPLFSSPDKKASDLNVIRSKWPVFSALLDMPDGGEALEAYSLKSSNPLKYRISSFLILRYVDKNRFNKLSRIFDQEFNHATPRLKECLDEIESGNSYFDGVIPADQFTN